MAQVWGQDYLFVQIIVDRGVWETTNIQSSVVQKLQLLLKKNIYWFIDFQARTIKIFPNKFPKY